MGKYSIVQPSLIQQLKSILDQYQDDGQILKELIQNAEDASAREVKFLLDERSYPARPESLHHPDLAEFQGPALYAYNDAYFMDADWTSLKMLGNSVKKDDPTKVGRFGLGFKSVFHVTDLPSVMSRDRICVIDPHERYFMEDGRRETGYSWHLADDSDKIQAISDQFEPYRNVFDAGVEPLRDRRFQGTLFRFPLRQQPSNLSNNIYSVQKVQDLFHTFQTAAEQMLIFLMSVESIELYRRHISEGAPTLVFQVRVSPRITPSLHEKRQQFIRDVHKDRGRPDNDVSLTMELVIESSSTSKLPENEVLRTTYLVSHYCRKDLAAATETEGGSSSAEGSSKQLADKLSYVPWASTAALVLPSENTEPLGCVAPCGKPRGQLFCFLPLPLQKDSPTGLPVHISGFFALSSSRHQVKWPSIHSSRVTDSACRWNQYLVEDVVPRAYACLLKEAVAIVRDGRLPGLTRHAMYGLFPDTQHVLDRWQSVLSPLFRLVFEEPVIHVQTGVDSGCWERADRTAIREADDADESDLLLRSIIARCLAAAASPTLTGLASVPAHVFRAVQAYVSPAPQLATPAVVRRALRAVPDAVSCLSREERLVLLDFILKDDLYDDLQGIPLLPVLDGTFASFSSCESAQPIYVASSDHPKSLLPQVPSMFLDDGDRMKDAIQQKLKHISDAKLMQLRPFNQQVFATKLASVLTRDHVSDVSYGKHIWEYMQKHFSSNISMFEGLPLLMGTQHDFESLVLPLTRSHPVLSAKHDKHVMESITSSALRRLGITVLDEVPIFVWSHSCVQDVYIFKPTPSGILEVLCALMSHGEPLQTSFRDLTADERRALRQELALLDIRKKLTTVQLKILKAMPLFEVKSQPGVFACVDDVKFAAPLQEHPQLLDTCLLLDIREQSSHALADLLGVRKLNLSELFVQHLKPALLDKLCPKGYIDSVMVDVLHNLTNYEKESSSMQQHLRSLPFVYRQDLKAVIPSEAFDPDDHALKDLLYGQELFPLPPYNKDDVLPALRRLGLGSASSLKDKRLLECARKVGELMTACTTENTKLISQKSNAILIYIEQEHAQIEREIMEGLRDCNWIVPLEAPPSAYPSSVPWFGTHNMAVSPVSIVNLSYAPAVGSSAPVLPREVSRSLQQQFGWDKQPRLQLVLQHFGTIIKSYRSAEKASFLATLCSIYDILQSCLDVVELLNGLKEHQIADWLWHGDGFALPKNMLLTRADLDCKPYVFVVPQEMNKYLALYAKAGAHKKWSDELLLDVLHMVNEKCKNKKPHVSENEKHEDLQLVLSITKKLAASDIMSQTSMRARLLLPAAMEDDNDLVLIPVDECTFCESESLNERRLQTSSEDQKTVTFVHPGITIDVAERLGVPSLLKRLLDPDDQEVGEGFGQSEPLTRRLKRLLEEYTDGLAVPKELIQNADDAGATEVKFIYDERSNEDAVTCLIDEGMRECQGPALWVFNNAVFTDEDFCSIVKLSDAGKAAEAEKIGGFGLGFNAVYNLTDVPSFVSREYIVIFDPHTTHLGRGLPERDKPGLKVNLVKNKGLLKTLRNQFKPYNGVCGCELTPGLSESTRFAGTLFRLPLRTEAQASRSEICNVSYGKGEVIKLFQILASSGSSILLFTQNVRTVSVYRIPPGGDPRVPEVLFSISKEPIKVIRKLEGAVNLPSAALSLTEAEQDFIKHSSILRAAATAMELIRCGSTAAVPSPLSSMLLRMHCIISPAGHDALMTPERDDETTVWLVVSCMGSGASLELALNHRNLSPTGGVAVRIVGVDSQEMPINGQKLLDHKEDFAGQIFCYLPLPIKSGLPVHINGSFAVSSNRRHLVSRSMDDKNNVLGDWNECLMRDPITRAYVVLLEDIRDLQRESIEEQPIELGQASHNLATYYDVWPIKEKADPACRILVRSFYIRLADDDKLSSPDQFAEPATQPAPQLLSDGRCWVNLRHAFMLDTQMRSESVWEAATTALKTFVACNFPQESIAVVDMPDSIRDGFTSANSDRILKEQTYGKLKLFKTVVFPSIDRLPAAIRDPLVLSALDSATSTTKDGTDMRELIRTVACIPVSPDGCSLSRVDRLVHPHSALACLYSPDERRFPYGTESTYLKAGSLKALSELGMLVDDLPKDELLARASAACILYRDGSPAQREVACDRASVLLRIIDTHIARNPNDLAEIRNDIRRAQFLPFVHSPKNSPCTWAGDTVKSLLLSPDEVFQSSFEHLLCYSHPILDEAVLSTKVSDQVKEYLGLNRQATPEAVLQQLKVVTLNKHLLLRHEFYERTRHILCSIYTFLQGCDQDVLDATVATEKCLILVGDVLVQPEQVSLEPLQTECAPYLFQLPVDFRGFKDVFLRLGLKNSFSPSDFINALHSMKGENGDKPLNKSDLKICLNVAQLLFQSVTSSKPKVAPGVTIRKELEASVLPDAYLPDVSGTLRASKDLSFDDCSWLPDDDSVHFVHSLVPFEVAKALGVKTKREGTLRRHALGIGFGQKERLTHRLSHIMSAYPRGKEIFKELVQNADDAGATVIHFVRDCRSHPTDKVFEDCWKPLQGPALCVYNNKPFTESDLKGIQSLGEGNKGADPNKTGQYGVGFNSVYHLTDAPSFLTCGQEVGEVLCVFDPNCKYVPGATIEEPGRKFTDIGKLRSRFPDVFSCYLESSFPLKDATMFRFPLRTAAMAKASELCKTEITVSNVDDLMKTFKSEMYEALLFVNNITEISLSDIPSHGSLTTNTYTVRATIDDKEVITRSNFATKVRSYGEGLKTGNLSPSDVSTEEACYSVNLEDSNGYRETWLVVQRLGFECPDKLSKSITKAFSLGDLCLLPRGGVAFLVNSNCNSKTHPILQPDRPRRVFCFLPLPITTHLPVHLNGHFALDHESRRALWLDDEGGGPRTDWNIALLDDVIAPSYIKLLKSLRDGITHWYSESARTPKELAQRLETYFRLFPEVRKEDSRLWSQLSKAVYRKAQANLEPLLPLLQEESLERMASSDSKLQWLPVSVERCSTSTYFSDLINIEGPRMMQALLRAGMRLLHAPFRICRNFEAAEVKVCCLSPAGLITFLQSKSSQLSDVLPSHVSSTFFGEVSIVRMIAKYCTSEYSFWSQVEGLPLGVSQANNLCQLSVHSPLFHSEYDDLLPECADLFLHRDLRIGVFTRIPEKITTSESGQETQIIPPQVFKAFTIEDLATHMSECIPESCFCNCYALVPWYTDHVGLPNHNWIIKVWDFMAETYASRSAKKGIHPAVTPGAVLKCLNQWALIPVITKPANRLSSKASYYLSEEESVISRRLVSIDYCKAVVDLSNVAGKQMEDVRDALRSLSVAELDLNVLENTPTSQLHSSQGEQDINAEALHSMPKRVQLAKLLISNLSNSSDILECLTYTLSIMTEDEKKKIKQEHSRSILRYFSEESVKLQQRKDAPNYINTWRYQLKQLPFYVTVSNELTEIASKQAVVLPLSIPQEDFHIWSSTVEVIFLKNLEIPDPLLAFLQCKKLDDESTYERYIFKEFSRLSSKGRAAHLAYVRDRWLPLMSPSEKDNKRDQLLIRLSKLEFLDNGDGVLRTAKHFYDPDNILFQAMLERSSFPPPPFDKSKWLQFLREIGLKVKPDDEEFVSFANVIASADKSFSKDHLEEVSKALVYQLFQRSNLDSATSLLQNLCQVPFIFAEKTLPNLLKICPRNQTRSAKTGLISLAGSVSKSEKILYCSWSTTDFVPDWADPLKLEQYKFSYQHSRAMDFPEYRKRIVAQLGVLKEPTEQQIFDHILNLTRTADSSHGICTKHQTKLIVNIMQAIFEQLQQRMPLHLCAKFGNTPFILLGDGELVKPNQLVLSIPVDQEIWPYLLKAPPQLAAFHKLLIHLGAAQEANGTIFAAVLRKMWMKHRGTILDQSDLDICCKAVRWLVTHLSRNKGLLDIEELYLPSSSGCLYPSNELVYNDEPSFAERLKSSSFDQPFLVDLVICHLQPSDFEDVLRKLPPRLKPKTLFSIIEECIDETASFAALQVPRGPSEVLRKRLNSSEFETGLRRLIWHEHLRRGKDPDAESLMAVSEALKNIHVYGTQKLATYLKYGGHIIEGSGAESECFVRKENVAGADSRWAIYIRTTATLTPEILVRVAEIINKIAGGLLYNSVLYLHPMLMCDPWNIAAMLDKLRIDKRGSTVQTGPQLQLGSFVSLDLHSQLLEDVVDFELGEYVGYELHDPVLMGQAGTATYIFSVVIEKVQLNDCSERAASSSCKTYRLDICDDKQPVASALDLYRLELFGKVGARTTRIDERSESAVDCLSNLSSSLEPATKSGDVTVPEHHVEQAAAYRYSGYSNSLYAEYPELSRESLDFVTAMVEKQVLSACKLDEIQRNKLLKRILLKFHPEKDQGKRDLLEDVTQSVFRVLHELDHSGVDAEATVAQCQHMQRLLGYRVQTWTQQLLHSERAINSASSESSLKPGKSSTAVSLARLQGCKNPQPAEGRRWLKQAEADLDAASNDTFPYEWVCFICHQAAEKALKGAQYVMDYRASPTADLRLLAEALDDPHASRVAEQLQELIGHSQSLCYPDKLSFPFVPHETVEMETATKAWDLASDLVEHLKTKFFYVDEQEQQ